MSFHDYPRDGSSYDTAFASLFASTFEIRGKEAADENVDFVALISQLSLCYQTGQLALFPTVNFNRHEYDERSLGAGSVFVVKHQRVRRNIPAQTRGGIMESVEHPIASKATKALFRPNGKTLPYQQSALRAFIKEVQILTHMRQHPNIINLLGVGWHYEQFTSSPTAQPRLILDYAAFTLTTFTLGENPTINTRLKLLVDVVRGLRGLHASGIVHGDLKPDNILVFEERGHISQAQEVSYTARIGDFSHAVFQSSSSFHQIRGTQGYIAPEIVRKETLRFPQAADVYSFGVTFWKVLYNFEDFPVAGNSDEDDAGMAMIVAAIEERSHSAAAQKPTSLIVEVLGHTIQFNPSRRDLNTASELLNRWALQEMNIWLESPPLETLQAPETPNLVIDYGFLALASGIVQDQLIANLGILAEDARSFRRNDALYELGICHLAQLGDPRKADPRQGLECVFRAASHGHIPAKGYFQRLARAHAQHPQSFDSPTDAPDLTQWLVDAAMEGHVVAMEELQTFHGSFEGTKHLHMEMANRLTQQSFPGVELYEALLMDNLDVLASSVTGQATLLHIRDKDGDSLLHKAAKWRNESGIYRLLDLGIEINSTNNVGETVLHHIWRFSDEQALRLIKSLVAAGIDSRIEARSVIDLSFSNLDPLPTLPGRAVERAAGRGRTAVVKSLLEINPPTNGLYDIRMQRMILWATRLGHRELRHELIKLCRNYDNTSVAEFENAGRYQTEIEMTTWTLDGQQHNFMTAVAQGWIGVAVRGWSKPEVVWRMCCHGQTWETSLECMILDILKSSGSPLCKYDAALLWAVQNSRPAFVKVFLQLYLREHGLQVDTNDHAEESGHRCVKYMNPDLVMAGFDFPQDGRSDSVGTLLNSEIRTSEEVVLDTICFTGQKTLIHDSIIRGDRRMFWTLVQELAGSPSRPWTFPRGIEMCTAAYNKHRNSLRMYSFAQDFKKSNRDLFEQLFGSPEILQQQGQSKSFYGDSDENLYRATKREWQFIYSAASGYVYLNCYSLSACFTMDVWFPTVFHDSHHIPHDHLGSGEERQARYSTPKRLFKQAEILWNIKEYLPPLYHALAHGNYHLARLLISYGASLGEPVCDGVTVLDRVLHETALRKDTLRFLFHPDSPLSTSEAMRASRILPSLRTDLGGYLAIERLNQAYDARLARGFQMSFFKRCKKIYVFEDFWPLQLLYHVLFTFLPHLYIIKWIYRYCWLRPAFFSFVDGDVSEFGIRSFTRNERTVKELSHYWLYLLQENVFPRPTIMTNTITLSHPPGKLPCLKLQRSSLLSTYLAPFRSTGYDILFGAGTLFLYTARALVAISQTEASETNTTHQPVSLEVWNNFWSHSRNRVDLSLGPIRRKYIQLLCDQISENGFQPTLLDIFLYNELDWWKWNEADTQLLRSRGWRHGMLFFAETYVVGIVVFFIIIILAPLSPGAKTALQYAIEPGTYMPVIGYNTVINKPGPLMPWDYAALAWTLVMMLTWSAPLQMWLFLVLLGWWGMSLGICIFDAVCYKDYDRFAVRALWKMEWVGYGPGAVAGSLGRALGVGGVVSAFGKSRGRWKRKSRIRLDGGEAILLAHGESGTSNADVSRREDGSAEPQDREEEEERLREQEWQERERRRRERHKKNRELAERMARDIKHGANKVAEMVFTALSWPIRLGQWAKDREEERIRRMRVRNASEYSDVIQVDDWSDWSA